MSQPRPQQPVAPERDGCLDAIAGTGGGAR